MLRALGARHGIKDRRRAGRGVLCHSSESREQRLRDTLE
jgi:hypothetical protein